MGKYAVFVWSGYAGVFIGLVGLILHSFWEANVVKQQGLHLQKKVSSCLPFTDKE